MALRFKIETSFQENTGIFYLCSVSGCIIEEIYVTNINFIVPNIIDWEENPFNQIEENRQKEF